MASRYSVTGKHHLEGIRILVVDDDPDACGILSLILRRLGAQVETADSVEHGLKAAEELHPDIVVSDITMPEQDGYAFVEKLRQLDGDIAETPAIALTANIHKEDQKRALSAGFHMHLAKPVDAQELVGAVVKLIEPN